MLVMLLYLHQARQYFNQHLQKEKYLKKHIWTWIVTFTSWKKDKICSEKSNHKPDVYSDIKEKDGTMITT